MSLTKQNLKDLLPSSTLLINEICKELTSKGKTVYQFGFGQSPFPVPGSIVQALKNNAHQKDYLPSKGLLELRKSISNFLTNKGYKNLNHENIIIGPGSKELMFLLQVAFDGEIILPVPSWVSYAPQAIIAKNKYHWIQTDKNTNWHISPEHIDKIASQIESENKLIILNSPNNPSGTNIHLLKELGEVFTKHNFTVLSDEIYSELYFKDNYKSISHFHENTIVSSSLSKWAGAGGWRVGYFAVPNSLIEIFEKLAVLGTETFSAVSAPSQFAAITAYRDDHSKYLDKVKKILHLIAHYVYEQLKQENVEMIEPEGGFYLMPDFTKLLSHKFKNSKAFCKTLLDETGVAVLPGSDFGFSHDKLIFRLSYVDFNGSKFLEADDDEIIEENLSKFAPKIVDGVQQIINFTKKYK